jgi:hypothetical protein
MRRFVLALAVVAVASCSSGPKGGGDGGGGAGGAPVDMTMSGPPDLTPRPTVGLIACGADNCVANQQLCCTSDSGATGDCEMVQNPSCGSAEFLCDGPEDCAPATPECCVSNGFASCYQTGVCATITGAKFMCHTTADCSKQGLTGALCQNKPNSPYGLCL